MKLLLTSGGLENKTMIDALRDLVGKDFKDTGVVFIPTAANVEMGDKTWLIKDLSKCIELGFKEPDVVDIAAVSQDIWQPRLENADVIMVGGGNVAYLMEQMKKSGLSKLLSGLLSSRVYVGISAGSMVVAPKLKEKIMQLIYDQPVVDDDTNEGLGFVDFLIVPHLNSPYFPRAARLVEDVAKGVKIPMYAIDDQTAIKVVDDKAEIISEGTWKRFN